MAKKSGCCPKCGHRPQSLPVYPRWARKRASQANRISGGQFTQTWNGTN